LQFISSLCLIFAPIALPESPESDEPSQNQGNKRKNVAAPVFRPLDVRPFFIHPGF
jgi:hypothetical protein